MNEDKVGRARLAMRGALVAGWIVVALLLGFAVLGSRGIDLPMLVVGLAIAAAFTVIGRSGKSLR